MFDVVDQLHRPCIIASFVVLLHSVCIFIHVAYYKSNFAFAQLFWCLSTIVKLTSDIIVKKSDLFLLFFYMTI